MTMSKKELRALSTPELCDLVTTLWTLWRFAPHGSEEERRCAAKWARAGEELVRRERRQLRRLGRLLDDEGLNS